MLSRIEPANRTGRWPIQAVSRDSAWGTRSVMSAPLIVTRLFNALRTSADKSGMGVLLVEQHVRKALNYVDHVYVMRRGKIELDLRDRI